MKSTSSPSHRYAGIGVAVGIALVVAACSATTTTTPTPGATSAAGGPTNAVTLSFSEQGCDPAQVTATAGDVTVNIKNTGSDTGEVEVVSKDKRVEGEAENVAPTFTKAFTAAGLTAGTYDIVCGSDKAPKGTLTVVGTGGSPGSSLASPGTTTLPGLDAAVDQYKEYVETQAADLQAKTKVFVAAIKAPLR